MKRVLRVQIGKKWDKGSYCLRIDERIVVSVVVLLSEYTAKRFEKEIEADRDVQIRIVQMFAFESK